jgi:hypothetical protein
MHTIQITEDLYRRLSEQAAQLHITPEQMLERLLAAPSIDEGDEATPVPPAGSEEALAAVQRLTGLFADVALPNLDAALADPLIALANSDLDDLGR